MIANLFWGLYCCTLVGVGVLVWANRGQLNQDVSEAIADLF